jgi:hypothetical protein
MRTDRAKQLVEKRTRQRKVENALLRGYSTQSELAARYGVSQVTIYNDILAIRQKWLNESSGKASERRRKRIKQLELLWTKALESYERSRKDEEETVTTFRKDQCSACGGKGHLKTKEGEVGCSACNGNGLIDVEVFTKKIRGQAGEASFLNVARSVLMDIARLEGLTAPAKKSRSKFVQNNLIVTNADKEQQGTDEDNPYLTCDVAVLHQARELLDQLERLQQSQQTIDVQPHKD